MIIITTKEELISMGLWKEACEIKGIDCLVYAKELYFAGDKAEKLIDLFCSSSNTT
jgi:tRNA A-37 threonylcarbamoyl transferase component Bud32